MRIDHLERVLGDFVVLWILYLGIKDRERERKKYCLECRLVSR